MISKLWRWLYFGVAYGWRERPFLWAVGPHPRRLNRLSDRLHQKWLESVEAGP